MTDCQTLRWCSIHICQAHELMNAIVRIMNSQHIVSIWGNPVNTAGAHCYSYRTCLLISCLKVPGACFGLCLHPWVGDDGQWARSMIASNWDTRGDLLPKRPRNWMYKIINGYHNFQGIFKKILVTPIDTQGENILERIEDLPIVSWAVTWLPSSRERFKARSGWSHIVLPMAVVFLNWLILFTVSVFITFYG